MADDLSGLLAETELTLLDATLERVEGPLCQPVGYLTFVDLEREHLLKWDPQSGETTVIRENTGEGNVSKRSQLREAVLNSFEAPTKPIAANLVRHSRESKGDSAATAA